MQGEDAVGCAECQRGSENAGIRPEALLLKPDLGESQGLAGKPWDEEHLGAPAQGSSFILLCEEFGSHHLS